jgi:hypothetical protein
MRNTGKHSKPIFARTNYFNYEKSIQTGQVRSCSASCIRFLVLYISPFESDPYLLMWKKYSKYKFPLRLKYAERSKKMTHLVVRGLMEYSTLLMTKIVVCSEIYWWEYSIKYCFSSNQDNKIWLNKSNEWNGNPPFP